MEDLRYPEGHVARELAVGCGHLNRTRGRPAWNLGCDLGSRHDGKRRRLAVESDTRGIRQVRSKDDHTGPHITCGR